MRILHVHTRYRQRGGEDSVVDHERHLLDDSGFEVIPSDVHNPTGALETTRTLAQSPWNRSASDRILAEARANSADLIHVHNSWFALSPAVVPKLDRAGFPVVMTFHNYRMVCVNAMLFRDGAPCELCVGRSMLPGVRYRCYRGSTVASAMVALTHETHRLLSTWDKHLRVGIALTDFARDRLVQGGLPQERLVVKPNCVPDPGLRVSAPSASREVLFVGRLSGEKGIVELIRAWNGAGMKDLDLVVVGTGDEEEKAKAVAGPGVRFVGKLTPEEVISRMLAARALVFPSLWYEVMPMVIIEALAAGLPVFHTDLAAVPETAGAGGVSLGAGDPTLMERGLALLMDDDAIDETGAKGRSQFESRFTEAKSIETLTRIYDTALRTS